VRRRVRGALGVTSTWAVGWSVFGLAIVGLLLVMVPIVAPLTVGAPMIPVGQVLLFLAFGGGLGAATAGGGVALARRAPAGARRVLIPPDAAAGRGR
jgi:hypothetical protein